MATLKDIATALNLSVPLVSKVLSGNMGTTGCSEANRLTILTKAREMNYLPNLTARALRNGRTGSFGVFVHPFGAPGSELVERLLMGLSVQANAYHQGLRLNFYKADNDFMHGLAESVQMGVDGLLVAGIFHPHLVHHYNAIETQGIPVVTMLKNTMAGFDGINVFCDEFQTGYLPTRHLLEQGCRRIAHIRSLDIRYQGYAKALQDYGLREDPALVYMAEDFGTGTGREAVRYWIRNGLEFDALVAESDHQALGSILELISHGRRVPEDVKVFGVDDSPLCTMGPVSISSVSQQVEEIGHHAVSALFKRINNEPAASVTIQPVLRLRASSGD